MWNHKATDLVSIDETGCGTDYAAVAFCECGWQADHWHHGESYSDNVDAAYDAAWIDGQAHLLEYVAARTGA